MHPFNKLHDQKKPGINGQLWIPNHPHSIKVRGTYHKTISGNLPKEHNLYKKYRT